MREPVVEELAMNGVRQGENDKAFHPFVPDLRARFDSDY
jgi:hypothetical protein